MTVPLARSGISVEGLCKSYGDAVLFEDIDLRVDEGEFMVIVGPSGCGKSSLMRVIAGIEEHDVGRVLVNGVDVTDAHPGQRSLSMVFQDYALYPHLTVEGTLTFGLRAHKVAKDEIRRRVEATAKTVGLSEHLAKRPGQLSGGQRQRVALGRAMIQEPRAFLMDEPLSNLDAALRVQMRTELIEFHKRVAGTVLYVTHDQIEAMTMGDRVAVMNQGRFEQVGTPSEIYSRPVNEYVATFLGSPRMNILDATIEDGPDGGRRLVAESTWWPCPREAAARPVGSAIRVGARPEALVLTDCGGASDDASLKARVDFVENLGNEMIVHSITDSGTPVVVRTPPGPLRGEDRVAINAPLARLHLFDDQGQAIWHGDQA